MSYICRQIRHQSSLAIQSGRPPALTPVRQDVEDPLIAGLHLRLQQLPGKGASSGTNVVSEELCDDALNLLAPSLEKYRGCNVIDILPGAGLWSRKVHELLRPRRHILVEDANDMYRSLLQPLLDQPDSRFRHRSFQGAIPSRKQFYDNVLADLDQPAQSTSQNIEPTHDILVLANLTKLPKVQFSKQRKIKNVEEIVSRDISPAEPFVFDFLRHLQARTGPHSFGPSRLLIWTLDRDKFNLMPKNVISRKNVALQADEACFLREIVGSADSARARRPANLELQSAIVTAERMRSGGIELPLSKRSHIHRSALGPAAADLADSHERERSKGELTNVLAELEDLEKRWAFDGFERTSRSNAGDQRLRGYSSDYARMLALRAHLESLAGEAHTPDLKRVTDLIHKTLTCQTLLYKLERDHASGSAEPIVIRTPGNGKSDAPASFSLGPYDLKQLKDRVSELSDRMGVHPTATMQRLSDDHEALNSGAPLIPWDQRPFEPLECSPDEFYPRRKLALLDFEPRHLSPEQLVSHVPLVRAMRSSGHLTVTEVLDGIAHGASEALMPKCPTMADPLRGGRMNPHDMRVRMLTHDMWRELVRVWDQWPFKKSDEQLTSELGTSSFFNKWN